LTKLNDKHVYKVAFGNVEEMIVVSETKLGYKAKPIGQSSSWQIWKEKVYSHNHGEPEIYHTEKTFLKSSDAIQFARKQLSEMVEYHERLFMDAREKLNEFDRC